ncbi:MAG: GDSL-type esterase/lipase family protein, partial [Gemmatimonadota bacterium]|nr:GDSL-type esterase/lipase family protein [Gemmatimonadota bacterium]
VVLASVIMALSCSRSETPQERAAALVKASLEMVRLEQGAMIQGTSPEKALGPAESLFLATMQLNPAEVRAWVETAGGRSKVAIEDFLEAVHGFSAPESRDDPGAVIMALFSEAPETVEKAPALIEGYAAAFQMCMELERDGTVMQDFMPFLLTVGAPLTFRDLGLDKAGRERLEELSARASALTGKRPYDTEPFDYFITMVKLDSWGSKFSGQVTADSLAERLMKAPEFKGIKPGLEKLPFKSIGFLGDSYMDGIHWSTQGSFPDITAGVMRRINPAIKVINAGKGGDDSGEVLERMDRDLITKKPEITFVMFGGNDCRHWGKPEPAVTPEQYVVNMTEIVGRLRRAGSRVVLISYANYPELPSADIETLEAINVKLTELKDSLGTGWIDLKPVLEQGDRELLYAVDRIHLSPEAHIVVAEKVLESLSGL